ncbi:MAG: hypothetical protein R3277_03115 [Brumimicrobium sp.]|nr:hypothetical protein [Brumimicrobium sp.]
MEFKKCGNHSVKNGKSKIGVQRYRCKYRGNSFQSSYSYTSFTVSDEQLILLTKEGCGIRSTARILLISPNTVIRRILKIGNHLKRPYPILKGSSYQVDELFTFPPARVRLPIGATSWCIVFAAEVAYFEWSSGCWN